MWVTSDVGFTTIVWVLDFLGVKKTPFRTIRIALISKASVSEDRPGRKN